MSNFKKESQVLANEYKTKNFQGYFQVKRHEMINYVPKCATKILDVGCADGTFGQLMKSERNVEVWGIEPNPKAAEIASKKLDKVLCDIFDSELEFAGQCFDCIVFNDVLEHMVDPYAALTYAKKILKDKGTVVASIPNVRYFDNIWNLIINKNWEYSDWGILDKTHLRFFTYRSIESAFENAGYTVEILEGINSLERFHPHHVRKFRILNRLFPKLIGDMRYLQFAVVASPKNT